MKGQNMQWLDKYGYPIEHWRNRPVKNFIRFTCQWIRGNWYGGRMNFKHPEYKPATTCSNSEYQPMTFNDFKQAADLLNSELGPLPVGMVGRLSGIRVIFNDSMPSDTIICNRHLLRGVDGYTEIQPKANP